MQIAAALAGIVFCYILGGIPFGLVAGKLIKRVDIRTLGSGNIGATNAARILGYHWGALIFLLDGLKGFLPVFLIAPALAGWISADAHQVIFQILFGFASFLGHVFSPFLKCKGGKGVATATGVLLGLAPLSVLITFGAWITVVLLFRIVSLASLSAAVVLPLSYFLVEGRRMSREELWILFFCLALALMVFLRHRSNIVRLLRGEEPRFGKKK